ncbi:MAG: hydroxymethylglutaryl-CoA lyase [Rhodospirillaceae bacterium]|jgi:hydroxymethylglutaryl-CoA lyase|nr:hydroxymethylglutaryl-CoA lyase [Rhodospirillaceae bacterium]MBT5194155.1 hydroxymethylglutaryl-CoA lyase [Rhodospirillaceae bacterium]MBT5897721.1 hydroxymethylglutaryl-CoA lyase [Rhodospirillaceae bacterium]MBT6427398.1 hydroxymethylglutaryl-CoA lyase [Rhodospirillaceae bacterium]
MRADIDVAVCEVGLRDGIQGIDQFFPTDKKKAWIAAEAAAGVGEIEVCSFVPPSVSGQFVDCEEVIADALTHDGLSVSALVPNLRGAERGFPTGLHKLSFVLSISESHNQANVRCSREESLDRFRQIAELRDSSPENKKVTLAVGLATALGCTIEGQVDPADVVRTAEKALEYGADELSVADTVGYANPTQVRDVYRLLRRHLGDDVVLGAHFHDTRGLGLANVHAALDEGVRRFDASLAGLGGCPFAPGASGNIVMDDLVFMLEAMGLKTGVDLDALVAVREIVAAGLPDEPLLGAIAKAGVPKGFAAANVAA